MEASTPTSLVALRDAILSFDRLRVVGLGTRSEWCSGWDGPTVSTRNLVGISELRAKDFVVTVLAGTPVDHFLAELKPRGLTLPLAANLPPVISQNYGTIGGLVSCGLPHGLEGQHRPIRDWVLGMQVIRGNGDIATVGSKVLKSVSGYDIHRFAVGARGELFAIAEITLRLFPLKAISSSSVQLGSNANANWVARLPKKVIETIEPRIASDPETGTVWSDYPVEPIRGWWMGPEGSRSQTSLMDMEHEAKKSFDPDNRFAGGWGL